jgi:hypothetical protein
MHVWLRIEDKGIMFLDPVTGEIIPPKELIMRKRG